PDHRGVRERSMASDDPRDSTSHRRDLTTTDNRSGGVQAAPRQRCAEYLVAIGIEYTAAQIERCTDGRDRIHLRIDHDARRLAFTAYLDCGIRLERSMFRSDLCETGRDAGHDTRR